MTTYAKPENAVKRARRVNPKTELAYFIPKPKAIPTRAGPSCTPYPKEFYDGKELRPFEGRPGAMDFKKCPSRGIR